MGLDFSSMPVRLGLTALVTILVIFLILRIVKRSSNRGKVKESATQIANFAPASRNHNLKLSGHDSSAVIDIKEQLKEITTLSELMIMTGPTFEIRQNSQKILVASRYAENLLKNKALLTSDAEVPNYKPVNVNFHDLVKSISEQWTIQLKGTNITFTYHLDQGVPEHLFLDEAVLGRILRTLLTNSQAMTEQGRIHFHVTASNRANYDWSIDIIIADTGRGFPKSFKDQLRNSKSSIKPESNEELNLLAVKRLLPIVKGSLKINSVEKRGTEVSISFPARAGQTSTQQSEIDAAKSKQEEDGPLSGLRVLIIEDDTSSQEVLQTFLVPEGCQTHCIPDGDQALKTLENRDFDLILMDVRMDGLDGISTTQAIRNSGKSFRQVPIIAITADVDPDTNAKCMMAGADLFLNKPIGAKALFDGIRFVLDLGVDSRVSQVSANA